MLKAKYNIIFPVGSKELVYRVPSYESFLVHDAGSNAAIFKELGIKDPKAFCSEAYGYKAGGGFFPECKAEDTEALQRVIDALLDECKKYNSSHPLPQQFQVGDRVRIKERKFKGDDYRESFIDGMAERAGQVYTILCVCESEDFEDRLVPDDGKTYSLNGISWNWSSGMLEKVSEAEYILKEDCSHIEKKEPSQNYVQLVLDTVLQKKNEICPQEKEVKLTIKKTRYRF